MNELGNLIVIQHCYDVVVNQIPVSLLVYSHIPTALVALLFGTYLVIKTRNTASWSFFGVCALFALWCFLDLNAWFAFLGASNMMFSWSFVDLIGLCFFFYSYRFLYAFTNGEDMPSWQAAIGVLLIMPTAVITLLGLNLTGFDTYGCEAVESAKYTSPLFTVQLIFILAIVAQGILGYRKHVKNISQRTSVTLAAIGLLLFLSFFFSSSFVVSLMVKYTTIPNPYNYEIYGLFGMPVLLAFLGYLIVRYRAFEIKMLGAQALIIAMLALTIAEFFFVTTLANRILVSVTVLLVALAGYFLIRSVQREVAARERNEQLAKDLAKANVRLRELDRQKSEFVSIASHQLRSPLTAIRGYASMILEGSFGKLPQKVTEAVERIHESSGFMALSIEDFLNVSRIEQGRMKYELADTDIVSMSSKIVDELRGTAMKKGLVLLFRSQCEGNGMANVDPGKTRQIVYNLVDNAIKYTKQGSVSVLVKDDVKAKRLTVSVTDSGVGMSEETLHNIFDKFVRAKNANSVNVTGTGLGLYVARQMAEAMGGTITPHSEGEGKGSTFTIELRMA